MRTTCARRSDDLGSHVFLWSSLQVVVRPRCCAFCYTELTLESQEEAKSCASFSRLHISTVEPEQGVVVREKMSCGRSCWDDLLI
jgi:hypothetical protein